MPDAPLPPALPPVPPRPPALRPPPPGPVVWLAFLFGPPFVVAFVCIVAALSSSPKLPSSDALIGVTIGGGVAGMVLGVCMVGGLALATRFFSGMTGRIVGGLLIGLALLIGLGGVAFAGCMCVLSNANNR